MFALNLKDSLLAYQGYYDQMRNEKKDLQQKLKGKINAKILALKENPPNNLQGAAHQSIEQLNAQLGEQMSEIDVKF